MTEESRIKVKVTKNFGWYTGDLDSVISNLQELKDEGGWVGVETYTDGGYDIHSDVFTAFRLYKFREENDKEYKDRMRRVEYDKKQQLIKEKRELKKKKERLKKLKKEISSMSAEDKKLLGL
jgi:predicted metalloprotease